MKLKEMPLYRFFNRQDRGILKLNKKEKHDNMEIEVNVSTTRSKY